MVVPKCLAPFTLKGIDHALQIRTVEAKRALGIDYGVNQCPLLRPNKMRAGQLPRQMRDANGITAVNGETVHLCGKLARHVDFPSTALLGHSTELCVSMNNTQVVPSN